MRKLLTADLNAALVKYLSVREIDMLRMLFGLDDYPTHTLQEIGDAHGVSRERARQIIKTAIKRLRIPERTGQFYPYLGHDPSEIPEYPVDD